MKVTLSKWGNSTGLRLPADMLRELNLAAGSEVVLRKTRRGITVQIAARVPVYTLKELVAKITPENRHRETAWGHAVGAEDYAYDDDYY